ncbi:MAG: hypothetical protein QM820_37780 [Minicystis sp.]
MRPLIRCTPLLVMVLAACAPPPPAPPPPVVIAPPPPAATTATPAPPPDPAIASVVAVRAPAQLVLDGDVAEWGSLLPPIAPPKADDAPPKPTGEKAAPPPDPNPRDAASHVAIAVSAEGARIAADLGEAARDGIWLGIGGAVPDVPPIGDWQRGGGVREFNCDVNLGTGEPNPPETKAACQRVLDQHAAFVAAHEARFRVFYRIDRQGVRLAKDDGTLASIDGAQAIFKQGPKGATVEASLPLKAFPRVTDAPLASLRFVARAATTAKPPVIAAETWVWLDLPDPIGFEPLAAIRAGAFEMMRTRGSLGPTGLSYHPADPLHVETVSYDRGLYDTSHVRAFEGRLYEKQAAIGEVEVGHVSAYNDWIAVLRKGKLVDLLDLPGALRGVIERDGELHVIGYSQYTATDIWADQASWSVMAIKPDGTHRDDIVDHGVGNLAWSEVSEFHDKALTRFGVRGWTDRMSGKPEGIEITWTWSPTAKMYTGKQRSIPVRKKAKKR